MPKYELGINLPSDGTDAFVEALDRQARYRGIRWVQVQRKDTQRYCKSVDRGKTKIGLFLNSQTDYTKFNNPQMLLCRSLKASGSLVLEDPDDAKYYSDRMLSYEYLERAGMSTPRRVVSHFINRGRRLMTAAQERSLGKDWIAMPALGLDRSKAARGSGRPTGQWLASNGFRPGRDVLFRRWYRP